jgi:hypothetical protein
MTTVTNKNGIEFDIDALATDVNGKMDRDCTNALNPVVVSRTASSQGGVVEVWSDGYCVQTGVVSNLTTDTATITFDKAYKDTNYNIYLSCHVNNSSAQYAYVRNAPTTEHIVIKASGSVTINKTYWRVEGYIR